MFWNQVTEPSHSFSAYSNEAQHSKVQPSIFISLVSVWFLNLNLGSFIKQRTALTVGMPDCALKASQPMIKKHFYNESISSKCARSASFLRLCSCARICLKTKLWCVRNGSRSNEVMTRISKLAAVLVQSQLKDTSYSCITTVSAALFGGRHLWRITDLLLLALCNQLPPHSLT